MNNKLNSYKSIMEQQDIKDVIKILNEAIYEKNMELVEDAVEQLKEYLDNYIGVY